MSPPPDNRYSSYPSGPPPRRPLDPQQRAALRAARRAAVRRRRLMAAGIGGFVLVCVVIAVVIAASGGAAPDGGGEASGPPTPSRSPGKSPKPSRKPTPTALPTPTAAKPLRIFAGGDSMGGEMGHAVIPIIYDTGLAKTVGWYKVSSGLVRPDFFDWMAYLKKYSYRYQAMVIMMGTNDAQNLVLSDGSIARWGTREWKVEYRERVGKAMDVMLDSGVERVYWVGMPVMESVNFNKDMMVINAAFRDEADKRQPKVVYIDTMGLMSADGAYDPRWRQSDGIHFNIAGTRRLADHVAGVIMKQWHIDEGTTSPSPSP
jgi:hypothetical protein